MNKLMRISRDYLYLCLFCILVICFVSEVKCESYESLQQQDADLKTEIHLNIEKLQARSEIDKDTLEIIKRLALILSQNDSSAIYFFSNDLNTRFEKKIINLLESDSNQDLSSFLQIVDNLKNELKVIYPVASPFLVKIKSFITSFRQLESCRELDYSSDCILESLKIFTNNGLEGDLRFHLFLKDSLRKESLSILEKLMINNYLEEGLDCRSDLFLASSNVLPPDVTDEKAYFILGRLEQPLNSKQDQTKKCLVTHLPDLTFDLCSKTLVLACQRALKISESLSIDQDQITKLKTAFILSPNAFDHPLFIDELVTKEVFSVLPINLKIKMFFSGYFSWWIYLVAIGFIFLILIVILLLFYPTSSDSLDSNKGIEEENIKLKRDEYTILLEIFGLDEDATNDDIKRSYRRLIKDLHPDSGSDEYQEEFRRIQEAYERLLELRKGWFGMGKE